MARKEYEEEEKKREETDEGKRKQGQTGEEGLERKGMKESVAG